MLRFVPPAGTPLPLPLVLKAWRTSRSVNGDGAKPWLSLAERLGARHLFAACSGRAGLYAIFRALQALRPGRSVVAVPAYTCFSVPATVARAGLRLHPVEIDPETLDYDFSALEALPGRDILCVLSANLFGVVNDAARIGRIAHAKGAFFVDDAAQSLGGSRAGQPSGTGGDVGFYSLGRGKALAAGEGGLIVTGSDEMAEALRTQVDALPGASPAKNFELLLKTLATAALLHPRLYWMPNAMPFLKLGVTEFEPGFALGRLAPLPQALLPELLDRLEALNQVRLANAQALAAALRDHPGFALLRVPADCRPTYIRFPVIARTPELRDRAVERLQAAGLGASPFYPSAICDIPGIGRWLDSAGCHCPRAEAVSRKLLTLPTHPYVRDRDLRRIREILSVL
jgi:perosamine synthetase